MGEFDNSADNVACDELNELLAMTGELTLPSSVVINALVIVAAFEAVPPDSSKNTVGFDLIDEITDENDVAFVMWDFWKKKRKQNRYF